MNQSVCAVIVTYHPSASMLDNMQKVMAQVQGLVVVDNGSGKEEVEMLLQATRTLGFHLIKNSDNLGIAQALNQGVLWAKGEGYPWVILFDQDSKITKGFVTQMFATWQAHPDRDRVCSVHPTYMGPDGRVDSVVHRAEDGGPFTSMTSGALMPLWIFDKIGMFMADYFIDLVDTEYCLRIRTHGYLVIDSNRAKLLHTAGNPERTSILGFTFRPSHHNAIRRYYMSRNRVALYRAYFLRFPGWVAVSVLESLRETVKCLLGESDRSRKLRNFLLGTWDGLTGRMGSRGDL